MIIRSLYRAFESRRLMFEPLSPAHAKALFPLMSDPRIYEWISSVPPTSVNELEVRWTEPSHLQPLDPESFHWAVAESSTGSWIGLVDAEVTEGTVATNIGYLFFPDFWRRGLASEAVRSLSKHLVLYGINKQFAYVTEGNVISEKVLAKAGFIRMRKLLGNDTVRGLPVNDWEYVYQSI